MIRRVEELAKNGINKDKIIQDIDGILEMKTQRITIHNHRPQRELIEGESDGENKNDLERQGDVSEEEGDEEEPDGVLEEINVDAENEVRVIIEEDHSCESEGNSTDEGEINADRQQEEDSSIVGEVVVSNTEDGSSTGDGITIDNQTMNAGNGRGDRRTGEGRLENTTDGEDSTENGDKTSNIQLGDEGGLSGVGELTDDRMENNADGNRHGE